MAGEDDIGIEASMLKLRASDLAMRMATEAVQLHGGYGYCKDYRVERLMRDAKITQIWEGTNQIHRQLIGRSFMTRAIGGNEPAARRRVRISRARTVRAPTRRRQPRHRSATDAGRGRVPR